jgi:Trypsin
MWCKVILVVLASAQLSKAALDCIGSDINVDGFIPRPQKNKAGFGEFPWTVALFKKDSGTPHCAGAIIGESTILTTGFCVNK